MKHVRPGYIPFQYKLLISYVLLLIIPIGVIGIYSYMSSSAAIERNTRNNLEVAVNQISSNVQYRVDDIKRSAEELYDDQLLSRYLNGRYEY
ncbi:sensory histidine kinase AtoS [compost metagenome]